MFTGTYRRDGEGDYLCTKPQVLAMLRDQTEDTIDMKVVDYLQLSDLNQETIRGYRNMHQNISEGHPFSRLGYDEYLRSIGAAAISEKDSKLHPTTAGLLMFGNDYDIVREFPEYFLDYREQLVPNIFNVWSDQRWPSPVIEEDANPARTRLILVFEEKQANKTSEQANKASEQANKTSEHKEKIIMFLRENGVSKTKDIAESLSLSPARVRVILSEMVNDGMLTAEGKTNSRTYSLTE